MSEAQPVRSRGVLALSCMLLALSALLAVFGWDGVHLDGQQILLGVVVCAGFAIVELLPIHLEGKGETLSFSTSEFVLVMGLLFCSIPILVVARVIGGGAALALHRRQPLDKLTFNVALQIFESVLASFVFLCLPGHGSPHLLDSGVDAALAVVASAFATLLTVTGVTRIHSGRWQVGLLPRFAAVGAFGVVLDASAALTLATAIWGNAAAVAPATVAIIGAGLAYRGHVRLLHRYASLEMVYAFRSSIGDAVTTDLRVRNLLQQTREVLRCDRAELLLLGAEGEEVLTRLWVDPDDRLKKASYVPSVQEWPVSNVLASGTPMTIRRGATEPGVRGFLEARGIRDCLIAGLHSEGAVIGVLLISDRLSDVATFMPDDVRVFHTVANQVARVLENGRLLDRLTHDSQHDALTGLANRNAFQTRLNQMLEDPSNAPVSVMMMDLDHFKEVNDTLGHHHGDLLIREVAERLLMAVPEPGSLARLGGDEFAVILRSTERDQAVSLGERIASLVAEPCRLDGVPVTVEASIGVATAPQDGDDSVLLLKRADMAMYAAKTGGFSVQAYDATRDEHSPRKLALTSSIRRAFSSGQTTLHYQPQIDCATGEIRAVEALMRWRHPEWGVVSPAEFVPIAEQSGAIHALTEWALLTAMEHLSNWQQQWPELEMSVNLSMRNLLDPGLSELAVGLLTANGISPALLTLEITESQLMVEPARTLPILRELSLSGVRLSIDDFGTGYSSLSYLRQLPVNEIKIDRSFISAINSTPQDLAISRTITQLARTLGLSVVAEGVEDQATHRTVRDIGCDRAQGYLYSRPLPAKDLEQLLSTWASSDWATEVRGLRIASSLPRPRPRTEPAR